MALQSLCKSAKKEEFPMPHICVIGKTVEFKKCFPQLPSLIAHPKD